MVQQHQNAMVRDVQYCGGNLRAFAAYLSFEIGWSEGG